MTTPTAVDALARRTVEVTMPQLGESVTEGQVSHWLKQPGDSVSKYEPLLEVITDKVNAEVPSPVDGVLAEIRVNEGETVGVGTVICTISTGDDARTLVGDADAGESIEPATSGTAGSVPEVFLPTPSGSVSRAGRASPAVRRLAAEQQLDISSIRGTGLDGRVTKRDVEEHLAAGATGRDAPATVPPPEVPTASDARSPQPGAVVAAPRLPQPSPRDDNDNLQPQQPAVVQEPDGQRPPLRQGDELIPLTPMRRAIAEHMVRSRHTSPHAWCSTEVDMTGVVQVRSAMRLGFKAREGIDLTFVPFVLQATCQALRQHPGMNATYTPDGILRHGSINLSIPVSLDDGLIVPVLHDADHLSLSGLAHGVQNLAAMARARRLTVEDLQGGTFCLNNPGTFGTVISAPIINQPQAAIMAMEAIIKRPVVLPGDLIGIRSMMFLSLSFDHRVMDGLLAASFLRSVKVRLEAVTPEGSKMEESM
ncbi:MAG: dihydrolipoamide acetyltransferase family protein [Candidatus Dormibacteria bacterium]